MFCNLALIIVLVSQPLYLYLAYKVGKGEKLALLPILPKKEGRKENKEEKLLRKEWENILNYDGTRESQEEIDC